jgi:hypothetical protein
MAKDCQCKKKNNAISGLDMASFDVETAKSTGLEIVAGYGGYFVGNQLDAFLLPKDFDKSKAAKEDKNKVLIAGGVKTLAAVAVGTMVKNNIIKALAVGLGINGLGDFVQGIGIKGIGNVEEQEQMYWDGYDNTTQDNDIIVNNRA